MTKLSPKKGFGTKTTPAADELQIPILPFDYVCSIRAHGLAQWNDQAFQDLQQNLKNPDARWLEALRLKWESCRDYNTPQGYIHLAQWGLVANCGVEEMCRVIDSYLIDGDFQARSVPKFEVQERDGRTRSILGNQTRKVDINSGQVSRESRTVDLSFSSELPVERGWWDPYWEVLGHDPGEADLSRLNNGGAYLWAHNWNDQRGVVESAEISSRQGKARVRFSRNPKGEELLVDIEDGIIRNVSFGYVIHEAILVKQSDTEGDTYRATKWEAFEISSVSIPADPTVGVGRAPELVLQTREAQKTMALLEDQEQQTDSVDERKIKAIRDAERKRVQTITKFGERFNIPATKVEEYVTRGVSIEDACAEMAAMPESTMLRAQPSVDLSPKDMREYSLGRVLRAVAFNDPTVLRIERDIHEEICKKSGATTEGYFIPELPHLSRALLQQRNQNVGTPTAGGNLVPTEYMPSEYIDLLRSRTIAMQLGPRVLSGMVGIPRFPRKTARGTPGPILEQGVYPSAAMAFDLVTMSPKKYGFVYRFTEEMLQQGVPSIEALIYDDILDGMAEEFDRLFFYGNGTTEPLGLANTVGINAIPGGTNGAAPTWTQIVAFQTAAATGNALSRTAKYVSNAAVMGKLKTTLKDANTNGIYLMGEAFLDDGFLMLNGHPFGWSNTIRSDRTKGTGTNLSDLFYGDWGQIIVAEWQGLEIKRADQDGTDFVQDMFKIKASRRIDYLCRYPRAFSAATDLITV